MLNALKSIVSLCRSCFSTDEGDFENPRDRLCVGCDEQDQAIRDELAYEDR